MKFILRLVLLAAAIAAGVWLWTVLFPGPEKIVRQRLAKVAADVSFGPGQNPLVAANNAERLASLFSTNVEVTVNVPGRFEHKFASREDITEAVAAAHQAVSALKVQFLDITVAVAADKQSAIAELTVKAQAAGDQDFIVQELKFTFEKTGGDWLITRVETVRTLS
jgi:SnoaL-like domain